MRFKYWVLAVAVAATSIIVVGCSQEQSSPVAPENLAQTPPNPPADPDPLTETEEAPTGPQMNKYWGNNIVSEAFYALSRSRSGGSSKKSRSGWTMSDWDYIASDRDADKRVSSFIGGCSYRGNANGRTREGFYRGGQCKYFANLILYRSSYGWGGGNHLGLPRGYTYAKRNVRDAGKGWVLQSPSPGNHTAIVVERYGHGLDVVDSNGMWEEGRELISRHLLTWSELDRKGYRAWCPWDQPYYIPHSGGRIKCY